MYLLHLIIEFSCREECVEAMGKCWIINSVPTLLKYAHLDINKASKFVVCIHTETHFAKTHPSVVLNIQGERAWENVATAKQSLAEV